MQYAKLTSQKTSIENFENFTKFYYFFVQNFISYLYVRIRQVYRLDVEEKMTDCQLHVQLV